MEIDMKILYGEKWTEKVIKAEIETCDEKFLKEI